MSEIQDWMNKIRESIWTGFGKSAKDVMTSWTSEMVFNMKSGQSNYPARKPLGIFTGKLSNALLGNSNSFDDGIQDDNKIVYERTVQVPYADISDKGGNVPITTRMKGFLIHKYYQTKEKKYLYMAFSNSGTLKHYKFDYVQDAVKRLDGKGVLNERIMPHILNELNKVQNIEVVIGNK